MTFIPAQQLETNCEPCNISLHNVMHWCRHAKLLNGSQKSKAKKFVEYDCIKYVGNGKFMCLPLNTQEVHQVDDFIFQKKPYPTNYNSSEYIIEFNKEKKLFICSCQGYKSKIDKNQMQEDGCNCSHVLALFLAFRMKIFNKEEVI